MTSIRTNARAADTASLARPWRLAAIAVAIAASALTAGCVSNELLDVETQAAVPLGLIE